ncbi:MAG: hypothetical protein ACOX7R_13780 [Acetivibrionales bacterium]|jgi:hypothetical protein
MVLYDGKHDVSKEEVFEKVRYYYKQATLAMEYWEKGNKKVAIDLARSLRNSLKAEYKNNHLVRIERLYGKDKHFINYTAAITDAYVSIAGQITYRNVYSFLYDVCDYIRYYFSEIVS